MKRILKIGGIAIGGVLLLAVIGILSMYLRGIPSYPVETVSITIEPTPERLARGEKLAALLCAGCHKDASTGKFTGKRMTDAPPEFGAIFSPNITGDKTYGIGEYTDGELLYLLRTGIKRDGSYAPPWMAKLPNMADEDIASIIAYLRSDAAPVAPSATPDSPCEPSLLSIFLCNVAFKPFPMPPGPISMPDTNDKIALGKYLAFNLECFSCHSADFKSNDYLNPEKSAGYFGGGNKPLNMKGEVVMTPNLTPDPENGIGKWTEAQFIKALRFGIKDNGQSLRYPMLPYAALTDTEAGAIFAYLQTIPPISNKVERSVTME